MRRGHTGRHMTPTALAPLALLATLVVAAIPAPASAAPVTYHLDPKHTFPHFDADHMGGMSRWRGMFKRSAGDVVLDKAAQRGTVDVAIEADSIEFGLELMNAKGRGEEMFDAAKYPRITYRGALVDWVNGAPTKVDGELTMHGVTKPVALTILGFKCMPHPLFKRDYCGADAVATIRRDDFGIDTGKKYGFDMGVTIRLQVEGIAAE